ncbi:hypothetical protein BBJ29_007253 [Phytophthora kernoviae]|uniref:Uncharacterized protein n=1 Tax=Phytophthora kernoviae TaxID=325452 RepID=A0A3R7K406_9STRA|nr:hypothetical protein BBJ29_007253 [Phytophthora kernoviae]
MTVKDLDARLRALQAKTAVEEGDWIEQGRKLYEFEDKFLRDTLLEGNIMTGWGEPRTAPVRFRNAGVRKRKRERQEAAAERAGKPQGPSTPTLSAKEQLKSIADDLWMPEPTELEAVIKPRNPPKRPPHS